MTNRQKVFNRYGGLCTYSGKPLQLDWQIDHMEPHLYCHMFMRDPNREDNLVPALKIVNHYKRQLDLEGFRRYMINFHLRLKKLPKNPRTTKTVKRIAYMNMVADAFGITPDIPFTGKFYFETLTQNNEQ